MSHLRLAMVMLLSLAILGGCGQRSAPDETTGDASGRIENGLRVLAFDPSAGQQDFRIYRGDYVRPELTTGKSFTIEIVDLDVKLDMPAPEGQRPYFKVPNAGSYSFRIGDLHGTIEAVDYTDAHYQEVAAKEAAALIRNIDPVILDVRTRGEFASGHLDNAALIPVQVLRSRVEELAEFKKDPVFIYCRTGNRSTVAAKMLIDAGFEQVINLRYGIVEWQRAGLPVVK